MKFNKLFEEVMDDHTDYRQEFLKSVPTDQLISIYIEDLYTHYTGGLFDKQSPYWEKAEEQINAVKQELLSRGKSEDELNNIENDIKEEIIADEEGVEEE